ncbi:MAG: UDP-3-O-(3-hydroxymyristoyl)glucosamine N-acyltransferase [Leptospiraceae bacterium]|nr:UDP-3-O-(3-hydroxymyristoyl)glucosamine N-acyltransferase [Leptospiraceae bacterium]
MNLSTKEILEKFKNQGVLESLEGEAIIKRIAPVEKCGEGDLVFVDKKDFLESIKNNQPSAVVTSNELFPKVKETGIKTIFISKNVGLAHAKIKQEYGDRNWRDTSEWGQIHPSAIIHPDTKIPSSCLVGPGSVIGKNVKLGENCVIQANVVIERNVLIGNDTIICSGVFIGYECEIGDRVIIQQGTIIGSEGFGFSPDENKHYHRIPQTGKVVVESDVRFGANCCFDRAAYSETRIKAGAKFDNLCHVAHNVEIGEDCVITAGGIVAGSTKLGKRVITSGQAGILDHLTIADDVVLLIRPGVTNDIKKPGIYAGTPTQPLSDFMKNQSVFRNLADLRMKVSRLEKELKKSQGTENS